MKIIVVEDQGILRESLAMAIDSQPDMEVIAQLADAHEALDMARIYGPDLMLMDVCTENDSSGIVAAGKIKEALPHIRIVIMTGMPEVTFIRQAREAKVDSFVYKNMGTKELLSVIRSTAQGQSVYPATKKDEIFPIKFSDDEMDILRLVCEAKSRKEIANELFLSEGTVKRRISEILAKTGYDSILKLAVHAVGNGYILPKVNKGQ